jgi:photosystem II 13kDa protein
MAEMQFSRGTTEPVVPTVKLTKSRSGEQSKASFYFEKPDILMGEVSEEITGLYMLDEEGEITTREVKAKFVNGKPEALEAIHIMNSAAEWDRFMRFMERYSEVNGLGFTKAE